MSSAEGSGEDVSGRGVLFSLLAAFSIPVLIAVEAACFPRDTAAFFNAGAAALATVFSYSPK